jgi:hypothetical protein
MPPRRGANRETDAAVAVPAAPTSNEAGGRTESAARRAAFIQCLMYKPLMNESDARLLMEEIFGEGESKYQPCNSLSPSSLHVGISYEAVLSESNQSISFAGLSFKTIQWPHSGERQRYLGLINKEVDQPAKQLGSTMTPLQRVYFLACLEKIMQSEPGPFEYVSEIELLNLELTGPTSLASSSSAMLDTQAGAAALTTQAAAAAAAASANTKLTKKVREQTLRELHEQKWLERGSSSSTNCNHFTIGVRSVMELGHMLLEMEGVPRAMVEAMRDLV